MIYPKSQRYRFRLSDYKTAFRGLNLCVWQILRGTQRDLAQNRERAGAGVLSTGHL